MVYRYWFKTLLAAAALWLMFGSYTCEAQTNVWVGIVNADTIWLPDFAREVGRRTELNAMGGTQTQSDVIESTWNMMVEEILVAQEAKSRAIEITEKEVDRILLQETPDFVRRGIVDEKGKFDYELLRLMLKEPEKLLKKMDKGLTEEQKQYQRQQLLESVRELRQRVGTGVRNAQLQRQVFNEAPLNNDSLFAEYVRQTGRTIADVVYLPCAQIAVEPTEDELRAWYENNAHLFQRQTQHRRVAAICWPVDVDTALPEQEYQRRYSVVIDSVVSIAEQVIAEYESGIKFGDVLKKYNLSVEFSPFFDSTSKVFDSYLVAQRAFQAQVGQMVGPLITPERGIILAVVSDSVSPGIMPFEAVAEEVTTRLQIEQQCKASTNRARSIYNLLSLLDGAELFVGAPIPDATIMREVSIQRLGLIGESVYDPLAAEAICDAERPGLMGPFRGDAGWYSVNIRQILPATREDFDLYHKLHGESLEQPQRDRYWQEWLKGLRESATIVDERWRYFQY